VRKLDDVINWKRSPTGREQLQDLAGSQQSHQPPNNDRYCESRLNAGGASRHPANNRPTDGRYKGATPGGASTCGVQLAASQENLQVTSNDKKIVRIIIATDRDRSVAEDVVYNQARKNNVKICAPRKEADISKTETESTDCSETDTRGETTPSFKTPPHHQRNKRPPRNKTNEISELTDTEDAAALTIQRAFRKKNQGRPEQVSAECMNSSQKVGESRDKRDNNIRNRHFRKSDFDWRNEPPRCSSLTEQSTECDVTVRRDVFTSTRKDCVKNQRERCKDLLVNSRPRCDGCCYGYECCRPGYATRSLKQPNIRRMEKDDVRVDDVTTDDTSYTSTSLESSPCRCSPVRTMPIFSQVCNNF